MKFKERQIAIQLRKNGYSYAKIFDIIDVSKSTLSYWLRDIKLTAQQKDKLIRGQEAARYAGAKTQQLKRQQKTQKIIKNAKREFLSLIKEPIFLTGLALYWAEGDKHRGERVKFTNSDPLMIALMMEWFRKICGVPEKKFRIALHIHDLHMSEDINQYWLKITHIPPKQFNKVYIKHSTLRQRRNILYNGTCGIVINNKDLFRRIVGWKLGLLKYFRISP